MSSFDYINYLKNNPLLQKEVKNQLITESQEIQEEVPPSKMKVSEFKSKIKEAILDEVSHLSDLFDDEEGMDVGYDPEDVEYAESGDPYEYVDPETGEIMSLPENQEYVDEETGEIYEAKKDEEDVEDVDIDLEDDGDEDIDDIETDTTPSKLMGLTPEEKEIQDSLEKAYTAAKSIGDEKLSNQLANSITFFTRTRVLDRD